MLHPNFVYLAALMILAADTGYLIDTIKGKVKPNRVSWLLWGLIPLVVYFAQQSKGVGIESIQTLVIGLVPLIIFAATFFNKKAIWKLGIFDLACGAFSILGLVLWYISKDANIAIILSIIADFFASVPTFKKSFTNPETESYVVYLVNGIAAGITLLTINEWNMANYAFLLYVITICTSLVILIKFKIGKVFNK